HYACNRSPDGSCAGYGEGFRRPESMALIDKDAVKRANRLEDVIPALTGHTVARRNGTRELVTRCPWHEDQHPSLRVNVEKQVWRCDPCDIGGDVFAFVERYNHVDFSRALEFLADHAGLASSNGHEAIGQRRPEREHVYHNEHGVPLFKVIIHGRRPDGSKIVSQA